MKISNDRGDTKTLYVYIHNHPIGKLCLQEGLLSFSYVWGQMPLEERYRNRLSHQFPISDEDVVFGHDVTEAFFSGLLPDEPIRSTIARILQVSPKNTFGLLEKIGGDCAGAVSIVPVSDQDFFARQNFQIQVQEFSPEELHDLLKNLAVRPLGIGYKGIRISGAGAQDKLMVTKIDNRLYVPLEGTPSTHIIKPNIRGIPDSVFNEFFCMKLAHRVGILVPHVELISFSEGESQEFVYMIERYDRTIVYKNRDKNSSNPPKIQSIQRLHQEDFCQVLGIPPDQKYQNEGGPSLKNLFDVIQKFQSVGKMKGVDKIRLLRLVLFNFLIGNGDAHGKNFSVVYRGKSIELAPGYDLLSTLVYGNWHSDKMAMKIGSKYKFKAVRPKHVLQFAQQIGISEKLMKREILSLTVKIREESEQLQKSLHMYNTSMFKKIVSIIQKQSQLFMNF